MWNKKCTRAFAGDRTKFNPQKATRNFSVRVTKEVVGGSAKVVKSLQPETNSAKPSRSTSERVLPQGIVFLGSPTLVFVVLVDKS